MRSTLIGFAIFACLGRWSAPAYATGRPSTVAEQYLFAAANAERAQRGLRPLQWKSALYRAADGHAQLMAAREAISHQFPGEPDLGERGRQAGAAFSVIAENVAEAPTAVKVQEAWMKSPAHRANLLDPRVDSVGIRVVGRESELYAVEDFDRSVMKLSLAEQEAAVGQLLVRDYSLAILPSSEDARRTCAMDSGYAGRREPTFIMRYTADDLSSLPGMLKSRLASGRFHQAQVAACPAEGTQNFTAYGIAVMLYR